MFNTVFTVNFSSFANLPNNLQTFVLAENGTPKPLPWNFHQILEYATGLMFVPKSVRNSKNFSAFSDVESTFRICQLIHSQSTHSSVHQVLRPCVATETLFDSFNMAMVACTPNHSAKSSRRCIYTSQLRDSTFRKSTISCTSSHRIV